MKSSNAPSSRDPRGFSPVSSGILPAASVRQESGRRPGAQYAEPEGKEGGVEAALSTGATMNGWRGAYLDSLPARGWEVKDGLLTVQASGGAEAAFGGDMKSSL